MANAELLKKQYVAELIGTFGLTLLVSLTLTSGLSDATAIVAAMTLGVFVYTIGGISGCHINPAVTCGLWSVKKIKNDDAIGYIVSQVLGALLAMFVAKTLVGEGFSPPVENVPLVGLAELLGAAFLVFGVCAVVYGKVSSGASGVTIGGSLLLGILVASTMSNGVLNPAVAIGIGSVSLMYVVGPLVGGVLAAQLYKWLVS